ncbi:hypothetical protein Ddye_023141 [Dipteronia dyeriana]|uniref:RNase H type-1 domain-containing protein n=1 Tax=Dipteronia dyeriana TaxID=168575 RepID=A0AAD9TTD0_9ROSI|nr:hypothetical protein Ddye_023141 [Dipteronia dyeriana]
MGLVIRDHHGGVWAASAQRLHASFSPLIAEAMAILCGLDFASDTGLLPVILETDALGKANLVTHTLSRLALNNVEDMFWLEEYPLCVEIFVIGLSRSVC